MSDKPRWWPGIWVYTGPFCGIRNNVLPWLGSDGGIDDDTWCRQTIVIPLLGLGAIIIGLPWHLSADCARKEAG